MQLKQFEAQFSVPSHTSAPFFIPSPQNPQYPEIAEYPFKQLEQFEAQLVPPSQISAPFASKSPQYPHPVKVLEYPFKQPVHVELQFGVIESQTSGPFFYPSPQKPHEPFQVFYEYPFIQLMQSSPQFILPSHISKVPGSRTPFPQIVNL